MLPDNAATVAAGAAVLFPHSGPTADGIVRLNAAEFVLPNIGTYSVDFSRCPSPSRASWALPGL
jgi:hypothetical protein